MATELSLASVVVLLSEFETQPIAALEALSLGCRLIVADRPGLGYLAEQGLARALPLEAAPADVARAILDDLERPPLADPPKLPTWDECADSLLKLYQSVRERRLHGQG